MLLYVSEIPLEELVSSIEYALLSDTPPEVSGGTGTSGSGALFWHPIMKTIAIIAMANAVFFISISPFFYSLSFIFPISESCF